MRPNLFLVLLPIIILFIWCIIDGMGNVYTSWGVGFLAGAIACIIAGLAYHICLAVYLSCLFFIGTIYLLVESFRWAHWKGHYYDESQGSSSKPPPNNLIKKMFKGG